MNILFGYIIDVLPLATNEHALCEYFIETHYFKPAPRLGHPRKKM
jgi:hypothetical protein